VYAFCLKLSRDSFCVFVGYGFPLVKIGKREKKKRQAGTVWPMRASGEGGCGPEFSSLYADHSPWMSHADHVL
jgi:hypothetical protein